MTIHCHASKDTGILTDTLWRDPCIQHGQSHSCFSNEQLIWGISWVSFQRKHAGLLLEKMAQESAWQMQADCSPSPGTPQAFMAQNPLHMGHNLFSKLLPGTTRVPCSCTTRADTAKTQTINNNNWNPANIWHSGIRMGLRYWPWDSRDKLYVSWMGVLRTITACMCFAWYLMRATWSTVKFWILKRDFLYVHVYIEKQVEH